MLAGINTKLAAHHAKLAKLAPQSTIPSDEETAEKEALAHPWKRPTMGKLCTADNTFVMDVTWPHEMIFTSQGKPAVNEELSVMAFVQGYLTVMDTQNKEMKKFMNSHLQELMADGEV